MLRLFAAAAFVASVSVSCSEISFIEINPPADLQEKIDAIQAEKDAANALLGDKTPIDIATPIVGAEDCTSAFFYCFLRLFQRITEKCLTLEFVNHGYGASNWNNWNMCVATIQPLLPIREERISMQETVPWKLRSSSSVTDGTTSLFLMTFAVVAKRVPIMWL